MKQSILNLYKENKNVIGILCLFIIIQPFLDISVFFTNQNFEFLGFTIPTLIRCCFIAILALISLKHLNKGRDYLFLLIYFILLFIYTLLHHFVASGSDVVAPSSFSYSLFSELFYIIRMIMPLAIIYFTRYSKVTYEKFIGTILISSLIIGTIIVVGNTLCISLTSYATSTNHTAINWIIWFMDYSKEFDFYEMTSKGWFYMANQVGGLMMLLLPFCIYDLIKKSNKLNIFATFSLISAMIMLGTRTASYGWLLICFCFIIVLIFLKFIKKEKWWKLERLLPTILIIFLSGILLLFSPINTRKYGYSLGDVDKVTVAPDKITKDNIDDVYSYIEKNYSVFGIQDVYIKKLYTYKYDPEFWLKIFKYSKENGVIENREMQTLITKRIDKLNDSNLKYKLFGYSFSRMRNGYIYIEHDFVAQAFTMGYFGLLLLIGPYIGVMMLVFIKILKKIKTQPKLIDFTFMISICALLFTSLFTGHLLDELFVMIYAGFICGFFLKRVSTKEIKIDEKN